MLIDLFLKVTRKVFRASFKLLFRILPKTKPIPIKFWRGLGFVVRRFLGNKNPLSQITYTVVNTGADIKCGAKEFLSENDVLGLWALDQKTIEFLWATLFDKRPEVIIESGSGISTVILATYASRIAVDKVHSSPLIVSLEQDRQENLKTLSRLQSHGLDAFVKILHAPLDEDSNYVIESETISRATDGRLADWLFIDGPSGPVGCRVSTLPLLAPYCKQEARWYLDDALRDGEMSAISSWEGMPKVRLDGIYAFGKGLATGRLNTSESPHLVP